MLDSFDVKAAEDALDVLVLAYSDECRKQKPAKPIEPTPFKWIEPSKLPTRQTIYRNEIVKNPIAGAFRLAIRELGEHIWQNTHSIADMNEVLETVIDRHPSKRGSLAAAIDRAWDGIGRVDGHAGWCA